MSRSLPGHLPAIMGLILSALPLFAVEPIVSSTAVPAAVAVATQAPVQVSTPPFVTMVFPPEGAKLPALNQIFAFGAVTPGASLAINGSTVPVHPKGGYLTILPLKGGNVLLNLDARSPDGSAARLERHFAVAQGFTPLPPSPLAIVRGSVSPAEDLWLEAGDIIRVSFQGSPQANAEFAIENIGRHIPMSESGSPGLYEGAYIVQSGDEVRQGDIVVTLKRKSTIRKAEAAGRLTIDRSGRPRVGFVTEDIVAARTGPGGGYDLFLFKGMKVRLTGKEGNLWRVKFAANQSGWVKDSAIQELPSGTTFAESLLTNMTLTHEAESTQLKMPLSEVLPYRVEQGLEPPQLTLTLYGAVNKTDVIRYDPADPLIRIVRWHQVAPDACQVRIEPKFQKWWGYDVRYEGTTLVVEIRKPWTFNSLRAMPIAIDPGHGGSDTGAVGPHGTLEKDANLAIARTLKEELARAGANPFLTRDKDVDMPLYERPRLAWKNKARIFISIHCNASGFGENPLTTNGSSVYWYQPQSLDLASAIHAGYRKHVPMIPDRGLFYADLAVCRTPQMPAVLTEQAYIIVPEQENLLFDVPFQKNFANAIVNGLKAFVSKP